MTENSKLYSKDYLNSTEKERIKGMHDELDEIFKRKKQFIFMLGCDEPLEVIGSRKREGDMTQGTYINLMTGEEVSIILGWLSSYIIRMIEPTN